MTIADQVQLVRQKISEACRSCGKDAAQVRLIAVSKTKPVAAIRAAFAAGLTDFGESYVQEAVSKIQQLAKEPICWHFIGPIQSNKTRLIAEHFQWVHSLDRSKIARRLSEQRPAHLPPLNVCVQVNAFAEPQKRGVTPEELPDLLAFCQSLPHIQLRGLMLIPPKTDDVALQKQQFAEMAALYQKYRTPFQLDTLSMGMSGDYPLAIKAGSNCVRVGSKIFGARD